MKVTINGVEIEVLGECEDIKINGNKVTIKPKTKVIKENQVEYIPYYSQPYYPKYDPYPYPYPYRPWITWYQKDTSTTGYINGDLNTEGTVSGNPINIASDNVTTTTWDWNANGGYVTAEQLAEWKKTFDKKK